MVRTDNGVLSRTLGGPAGAAETYRPYLWSHDGRQMHALFRDHYLSDLVGFVYSKMGAEEAADHFLGRIRENCGGRDSLVPIILDGENAWEHYPYNGYYFFEDLYGLLAEHPRIRTTSYADLLARPSPPAATVLPRLTAGS